MRWSIDQAAIELHDRIENMPYDNAPVTMLARAVSYEQRDLILTIKRMVE